MHNDPTATGREDRLDRPSVAPAAHFHPKESEQVSGEWAEDDVFGITRLQSATGIPDRTTHVPSEAALHISVAILPVPLGT